MIGNAPGKVSDTLLETARTIPAEGMTLNQLLGILGEQGLLLFCIFLTIPFVLPIQIPGSSTILGLLIALIALGITMNRFPRFPDWLMERQIASAHLIMVLEQGARLFARFEHWVCPRWFTLTRSALMNRVTGLVLMLAAGLLALPLIIPFSNVLPALAILILTVGILQRDGLFILGGYALTLSTTAYFVAVTSVTAHSLRLLIGAI